MTRQFKRLSVLIALVMVFGAIFTGCQGNGATPDTSKPAASEVPAATDSATAAPKPDKLEPYQIDWLFLCNGNDERISLIETAVNKILEEKINATIKINMQSWNDHKAKVQTLLSSGEKLDLVFTAQWWEYQNWSRLGYFRELNDLIDQYAPETKKLLGEDVFIKGSAINGVNYAVPTLKETCVPNGMVFNKVYLDKYNWDKNTIKKVADLEPWLAEIKSKEAGVIPYLNDGGWADSPFTSIGITDDVMVYTDGRDTKVHNVWESPEKDAQLKLARKWFEAGYYHPDVGTTGFNMNDTLATGKFFAHSAPVKGENVKADELQGLAPAGSDYVDVEFVESRYVNTLHMSGSMQAIPVTSKDPARAMMFLELLHTDVDLINTLSFGIEGTHYTKTDKPGIIELNKDNKFQEVLPQWMLGNVYLQYITTNEDPTKMEKLKTVSDNAKINFTTGFFFDPTPVEAEIAAINNIRSELATPLNCGQVDPAKKADMIQKLKDAGVDKVIAEAQKQLDDWMAKNK